jgi:orotate phosphoribosyltransferase
MSELDWRYEDLASDMLDKDIVKFGKFTLKSGKTSVAYVNLRDMISMPRLFRAATAAYKETLEENPELFVQADGCLRHLLAIPEAATYYGGAVAHEMKLPLLYHRVKSKDYGQPRAVEGRYKEGDEVVLLDDVVTTAGAKLEEAQALADMGLKATGVVVLVDREQGGRTELKAHGLQFAAAMTLSGIAKFALDESFPSISQTLYDELLGELNPEELTS